LLLNYDFGIILPPSGARCFELLKFISSRSKHTLPCSDEHQNPPTYVAGFEVNHLAEKQAPKCRKYSRCKVKSIDNKMDIYSLCQPLPNTTTRKEVMDFLPLQKMERENQT
jgi:hypothetical protein